MRLITLRAMAAIAFAAYAFGFRSGWWLTGTLVVLIVVTGIIQAATRES